jgi:hypothetical protein
MLYAPEVATGIAIQYRHSDELNTESWDRVTKRVIPQLRKAITVAW